MFFLFFYPYRVKQVLYGKTYQLYTISSSGVQRRTAIANSSFIWQIKQHLWKIFWFLSITFSWVMFSLMFWRENSPIVCSSTWFGMQLVIFTCIDCFPPSPKLFFVQDHTRYSLWMWCQIIYCFWHFMWRERKKSRRNLQEMARYAHLWCLAMNV